MTSSKPIVTIVGHVCIDQNTIDGVSSEKWGSSPMYIANYLKNNHDIQASILAPYGTDFNKYTEGFSFINSASIFNTLIYQNIVTAGKRIQFCHNADLAVEPEITPQAIDILHKTDILIVTPMTPSLNPDYILTVLSHLPKKTLKLLLPQGYMRQINSDASVSKRDFAEAARLLPIFDALIASDEDYSDALGWAKQCAIDNDNLSIIITRAEKGASLFKGSEQIDIETTPISFENIKNPVGSGDIFSAQLSVSLHTGLGYSAAIDEANKATGSSLLLPE